MSTSNVVAFNRVPAPTRSVEPPTAVPFIKWAGGKRSLLPQLVQHFPNEISTYWEPFLGGGAVFFALANRIHSARLSDSNVELMITYQVVKERLPELLVRLRDHERKHQQRKGRRYADGKTYYLKVRANQNRAASANQWQDDVEVASRFIYLNKTCFNGLYRVNKRGEFNVPEGGYLSPDICNEERIRTASEALAGATLEIGDFVKITPSSGDLVYCDPPYDGTFTGYQAEGFDGDAQARLRNAATEWAAAGATVVLSNADTAAMRELYSGPIWKIHKASAPRVINSNGSGRDAVAELIITNG